MATLSKEQAARLDNDVAYMRQAGMNQGDIDAYLDEQLAQAGEPPLTQAADPTGRSGLAAFFRTVGPIAGGVGGGALAARSGQVIQSLAEGAGTALGDVAGRFAAREPQDPMASVKLGAGAATIGPVFRGVTRMLGRMGGVPRYAVEEAGVPTYGLPSFQKVGLLPGSSPGPRNVGQVAAGASSEESLADRARLAVSQLIQKFTPERLRKTQILAQAGASGAKVDLKPIMDKLIDQEIPNAVTDAAKAHNAAISRMFDELHGLYNAKNGALSPLEADEMIRRQLNPKAYTASGDPAPASVGTALRDVQTTATQELNRALPKEVRSLNQQISAKLDAMDEAERLFGVDRAGVVNRIRNLYAPGNEDNVRAFNFLAKESGDKNLARKALTVATKRDFTEDIRVPSETRGRPVRTLVETGTKAIARGLAPLQPYTGPVTAGLYPEQTGRISEKEMDLLRAIRDFAVAHSP